MTKYKCKVFSYEGVKVTSTEGYNV